MSCNGWVWPMMLHSLNQSCEKYISVYAYRKCTFSTTIFTFVNHLVRFLVHEYIFYALVLSEIQCQCLWNTHLICSGWCSLPILCFNIAQTLGNTSVYVSINPTNTVRLICLCVLVVCLSSILLIYEALSQ